jgi:hypothetical protein
MSEAKKLNTVPVSYGATEVDPIHVRYFMTGLAWDGETPIGSIGFGGDLAVDDPPADGPITVHPPALVPSGKVSARTDDHIIRRNGTGRQGAT